MKQNEYPDEFRDAIENSNKEKVQEFINKGINLNAKDKSDYTPLYNCVQKRDVEIAQLLLDNGADINQRSIDDYTPLHYAASREDIQMLQFLIMEGADVNLTDSNGNTPLFTAVMGFDGVTEIVDVLLKHGADPYAINKHGIGISKILSMPKNDTLKDFFKRYKNK